ncbi:MAG: HAD family hydrolase [Egibacteraceae bacterium]
MYEQGVLFDFHDTLVQLRPSTAARLAAELELTEAACSQGLHDLEARVGGLRRQGRWPPERDVWTGVCTLLLDCLGVNGDGAALAAVMSAHYRAPSSYQAYPDVAEPLAQIHRQGVRLGVLSNTDIDLWAVLDHRGLSSLIDIAVPLLVHSLEKPQAAAFQLGLDELGVPAASAWLVGDSLHQDAAAAQVAGINAVLLDRRGLHTSAALPPGVTRTPSLDVLPSLLKYHQSSLK